MLLDVTIDLTRAALVLACTPLGLGALLILRGPLERVAAAWGRPGAEAAGD